MNMIKKLDFIVRDLMILLLSFQITILSAQLSPIAKTCHEVTLGIWGILFICDLFIKKDEVMAED